MPFLPDSYTIKRNYSRVFQCAFLAKFMGNQLVVTDICRDLANTDGKIKSADDYLFNYVGRFRFPFPAFDNYNAAQQRVYPFCAILKLLIAQRELGLEARLSLDDIFHYIVGNNCTGFDNILSIEVNEIFCNTLRVNNPHKMVIGPPQYSGDISKREELAQILMEHGITENFPGVFHGGPPCQSFSIAANQRFSKDDDNFKRKGFDDEEKGTLIFDYIWFIKKFRPVAFLIENVAGIMECDNDGRVKKALDSLASDGYTITKPRVLNAANYGVPQNRMRWIVAGTRKNTKIILPEPAAAVTPCGSVFLRSTENVENHVTRKHTAQSICRYMKLPYGGRDKLGRVDRLDPRLPSKTVIAGGTKGGGRSHLHPFVPRTLSVRECARLQTFPDDYIFTGANARQFTQVGNAVPPLLAYKLAMAIKHAVFVLP